MKIYKETVWVKLYLLDSYKVILPSKFFTINNDLEIHKQVKTNEIKFQRFGDFMTPLSRNDFNEYSAS